MALSDEQFVGDQITDEGIARLRARIPLQDRIARNPHPAPGGMLPHVRVANADAFRHFAHGYGDDNPLWHEDDYAKGTRWGEPIAPPGFSLNMGEPDPAFSTVAEFRRLAL